jgi:site-specific recombinase XerD
MASKLTLQTVKAAKVRLERYTLWDSEVKGFGLRVNTDESKSYVLKYTFQGRQRWHTIGRHGSPWTPDTARREALKLLGQAKSGTDPILHEREQKVADVTVAELCNLYLAAARAGQILTKFDEPKKASTLVTDASRIQRHIKPLLGKKRVRDVTSEDVEGFLHAVAAGKTAVDVKTGVRGRAIVEGGRGAAARTVGLLGGIFNFAVKKQMRSENPVRGVQRFKDKANERFLSMAELTRLGKILQSAETAWTQHEAACVSWAATGRQGRAPQRPPEAINPVAIAAIRLLLLTGARKGEVLQLQWEHVDFSRGYLRLPTSKTGAKLIPLGAPALELLSAQPRLGNNPYVFPGDKVGTHFVGLQKVWERLRKQAGLHSVRLHDLRHSFASAGAEGGNSLLLIGALLGHRDPRTTKRYAHIGDDPARAAADRISSAVATAMKALAQSTR